MSFCESMEEFMEEEKKLEKLYVRPQKKTLIYKLLLYIYYKKKDKMKHDSTNKKSS